MGASAQWCTHQLEVDVLADQAKATYEDGSLRVEIPIAQAEGERRQVPIRARDESAEG